GEEDVVLRDAASVGCIATAVLSGDLLAVREGASGPSFREAARRVRHLSRGCGAAVHSLVTRCLHLPAGSGLPALLDTADRALGAARDEGRRPLDPLNSPNFLNSLNADSLHGGLHETLERALGTPLSTLLGGAGTGGGLVGGDAAGGGEAGG
ncbi:hypothetical protein T484DRAFT_1883297, partial [Baffinella frigidus]